MDETWNIGGGGDFVGKVRMQTMPMPDAILCNSRTTNTLTGLSLSLDGCYYGLFFAANQVEAQHLVTVRHQQADFSWGSAAPRATPLPQIHQPD
jgi:hypothetical protein